MDKMKQEVKGKLAYWTRLCALFTILMTTNFWDSYRPIGGKENFPDFFNGFFDGFQLGITVTFLLFAVINIMKYKKLLRDEEALRTYYIKEHDERTAAIQEKSGGTVLYNCGVIIIGAGIVAGYFNPTVFMTLLICGVFLLLVKKGLLIYYCKTM